MKIMVVISVLIITYSIFMIGYHVGHIKGIDDCNKKIWMTKLHVKKERLVTSDEDCADCLCRVCARNSCNDSYNRKSEEDGRSCECNCKIGDKLIETEDDCPDFLPDEDN